MSFWNFLSSAVKSVAVSVGSQVFVEGAMHLIQVGRLGLTTLPGELYA